MPQSSARTLLRRAAALPVLLAAMIALPGAAASAQASGGAPTAPPARQLPRGIRLMSLRSPAFESGAPIPDRYAQPGRDVSPPLVWSGAPDSTRSFVLVVHDLDAPIGDGTDDTLHWLVWNIPGRATGLPEGVPSGAQLADGTRQVSVSGPYYRGPAAPASGSPHHYLFELYALDTMVNVPTAVLPVAITRAELMKAIANHVIGKGVLVGRYQRVAP